MFDEMKLVMIEILSTRVGAEQTSRDDDRNLETDR